LTSSPLREVQRWGFWGTAFESPTFSSRHLTKEEAHSVCTMGVTQREAVSHVNLQSQSVRNCIALAESGM
jgi:hypothetical protein